jgi:hypothetical protein
LRFNKDLLLTLLIATIVFSIGINWGLPIAVNPETVTPWGVDTVAPIQPLNEAYYKFTRAGNEWMWYPLFHFVVLDISYAPYVAWQYIMGNMENPSSEFPYGLKNPVAFCKDLTLIARLVSLLMALGIVLLIYKISENLFSPQTALYASLITALSAPLTFYSKTSNLDVPYLFWSFLALWYYLKVVENQKLINYVLLSISVALAVSTKDQAYGFFVLIPFVIIYILIRHQHLGKIGLKDVLAALFSKPIIVSLIVVIFTYGIANNLFFGGGEGFINRMIRYGQLFNSNMAANPDAHTLHGQISLISRSILLIFETLGIGWVIFAFIGVYFNILKKRWIALSILVFPISYYLFCIAEVGIVYVRYMLGPALILTPFAGNAIETLLKKSKRIKVITVAASIISILLQILLTMNLHITLIKDSRYLAESWIKENIPSGSRIESNVIEKFLPHISEYYSISVKGVDELNRFVADDLSSDSLKHRNPDFIIIVRGLGVTGDPDKIDDPKYVTYFNQLLNGEFGYEVVAKFETPHFLWFRQVVATRPDCIILGKKSALEGVISCTSSQLSNMNIL